LKYLARTQFPAWVHVLPEAFDHYFVSMAMPQGSPLREPLNRVLLKAMEKEEWEKLKKRYLGSGD
jgi:ABC-type amino acid transport substrate-binding protein